jgi:hypothetical protein
MASPGNAPKSAIYGAFRPPILPYDFRGLFGEDHPAVFWRVPTGAGWYVPKTLELGTTGFQPDVAGKTMKIMFQNGVRKPVFRYSCVRGFKERVYSQAAQSLGSERPHAPPCAHVVLRTFA